MVRPWLATGRPWANHCITCDSDALVEPVLLVSPLYVATTLYVPAPRLAVLQDTVLLLALPAASATARHPPAVERP